MPPKRNECWMLLKITSLVIQVITVIINNECRPKASPVRSSKVGRYLTTALHSSFGTQSLAGRALVDQYCNDTRMCDTNSGLLTERSATLLDDFLMGHVNEGGQEVFLQ